MTRSYVDNEITIYASQNPDHRSPRSLLLRKNDKNIYDRTVTAEVYREVRPEIHIIEDTSKGKLSCGLFRSAGKDQILSGLSRSLRQNGIARNTSNPLQQGRLLQREHGEVPD